MVNRPLDFSRNIPGVSGLINLISHRHRQSDVDGLATVLNHKADIAHTHEGSGDHTHLAGDVTNLSTLLAGKSNTGHTHGGGYVNVKDYGAIGDGTTNDTAAVTAAINAAVAARTTFPGGGEYTRSVVWFPPGTYLFGAQTLPVGIYIDGDTARLRPTAAFTGNWITLTAEYAGIGPGVWLQGNNVNGEVAVKINSSGFQNMISASFTNWGGKCIRDEGVATHIDSALIVGMKNTAYINGLTAGSYVGTVELAGNDAMLGKCEVSAERYITGVITPSTNKVVAALFVPGGSSMVDGAVLENGDIGVYNTGFGSKYKNTRTEFCGTHGFWMAAGSGQIFGCQAMGNSRIADNTYDGFHIDSQNWYLDNNYSTSDNPGDAIKHRYGLYNNSAQIHIGKFVSEGGDHNAYRDAINSVTYSTMIDPDPRVKRFRDINGNTVIDLEPGASATSFIKIANDATIPSLQAQGTTNGDLGIVSNGTGGLFWYQSSGSSINFGANGGATDIDWNFNTKGAGSFKVNGVPVLPDTLNVRRFGAVGNGITDDSAAFESAWAALVAAHVTTYTFASWRSTKYIDIPAGTYRITNPGALMKDLGGSSTIGVTFRGAAVGGVTTIVFAPSTANEYLAINNDQYMFIEFENINFVSETATASFMKSTSSGIPKNIVFDRCTWFGNWKYGVDLHGTDTNGELAWFRCGTYGNWTAFLYAGATDTNDNFLNYDFYGCTNEVDTGNFIDMAKGGNINVWGGGFVHVGNGTQSSSAAQTFFRLRGSPHSSGVQRLLVTGARFEQRHENSQLINCEWGGGNVTFQSCDTEGYTPMLTNPNNVIQAEFGGNGSTKPVILFDTCVLTGKHKYHFDGGSYVARQAILYRGCNIAGHLYAADFITYANDDATNLLAGVPPVKFVGCRGSGSDQKEQFDCTVGWPSVLNAVVEPKVLSLKHPWGGGPIVGATSITANLPLGAIITRVRAWKTASGSATSTTFTYTLVDGTPTTIATVAPGTAWNAGWTYDSGLLHHHCSTTTKRQLTLSGTNLVSDEYGGDIYFLVEYLA